jgi:hypothetical protein
MSQAVMPTNVPTAVHVTILMTTSPLSDGQLVSQTPSAIAQESIPQAASRTTPALRTRSFWSASLLDRHHPRISMRDATVNEVLPLDEFEDLL